MTTQAVFFDLDGTLVDTAVDLIWSLNQLREEEGLPPVAYSVLRASASHGSRALIKAGFGISPDSEYGADLCRRLLTMYQLHLSDNSRLFADMANVLDQLDNNDICWGIVTNKPKRFTLPLLQALHLSERAACIVSGDTLSENKPHPAQLLYACQITGCNCADCLYVGDAQRDIEAGNRAGMQTVVVLYGYLGLDDEPLTWGADFVVKSPLGILDCVSGIT